LGCLRIITFPIIAQERFVVTGWKEQPRLGTSWGKKTFVTISH